MRTPFHRGYVVRVGDSVMWYCNECRSEFEDPKVEVELHTEVDGERREYFEVCPICGSGDFEEEETCALCDLDKPHLSMHGGRCICEDCVESIAKDLNAIRDRMHRENISYSRAERIIQDIAEEIWN